MAAENNPIFIKADGHDHVYIFHAVKDEEICLPSTAFDKLIKQMDGVTEAAKNRMKGKWALDKDWYIHINLYTFPTKKYMFKKSGHREEAKTECLIHLRRWFTMKNERLPTKEGLTFTLNGWLQLTEEVLFFAKEISRGDSKSDRKRQLATILEVEEEDDEEIETIREDYHTEVSKHEKKREDVKSKKMKI